MRRLSLHGQELFLACLGGGVARDALLAAQPEVSFDETFRRVQEELRTFDGIEPAEAPDGFSGELRSYQKDGLGWLHFLRRFGFGGCLADDMGLGKTVQALALLETRRQLRAAKPPSDPDRPGPTLAVVPRSVLFNWEQEAARFTPALSVQNHSGLERARDSATIGDSDLILTTYGTLRRDAAFLKDILFDYVILDEAQAIKNADTATAIGSGTYVYGVYVLKNTKAADGKPVNDHVEWVAGGASTTMLGGLKAGKFDAIMAVPEWQSAAVEEGFGHAIYDIADEKAWNRVFGGPIPVTVGYVLKETVERSPDLVQGYVNACYHAQQWIRKAKDDEIVDLLWKPYMGTFKREVVLESVRYYRTIFDWDFMIEEKDYERGMKVWVPIAVDKPIPFAKAVDMSFVRKAQARFGS